MIWKNKRVNMSNYQEVFRGYSRPIRELVRSAIMDDTPIGNYIDKYKNNYHMLWEVKLALEVGLDPKWFDIVTSHALLSEVRVLFENGMDIEPLAKHFSMQLSSDHYKYILKWYKQGISLDKYDFSIVDRKLLSVYDSYFNLGISMEVFNTGESYSVRYLVACVSIYRSGNDVSKFLDGKWDEENLLLLAKYSKSKYYKKMIGYVDKEVTPSLLEEMYALVKQGSGHYEELFKVVNGEYVYSDRKLALIRKALLKGYDYVSLIDDTLSLDDMYSKYNELELTSKRKVSGRLRKN